MKDKQNKNKKSNQFNEEVGAEMMDFETTESVSSKKEKKSKKNKKNN